MGYTRTLVLLAGAALGLGAGVASAQSTLDQSRAYQSELQADAAGRTSLLTAAQPSGHDDKGFFVASGDNNFRLNVGGFMQFRYIGNFRQKSGAAPDKSFTSGFQTARTRLIFNGNVINPDLTFQIDTELLRSGGGAQLKDAYAKYKLDGNWSIKWGQYKLPLLREELIPDTYQLAVERSITNSVFTQSRSQGVEFAYEADQWRAMFDFSDGIRSLNTDFNSPIEADWALTARGEWKWAGDWKQFRQFTSWQNSEYGGLLGVAAHYQKGGGTGGPTGDFNILEYTADASVVGNGWNLYAAFIGRYTNPHTGVGNPWGPTSESTNDFGGVVQGGVFISSKSELFGRWDGTWGSKRYTTDDSRKSFNTLTVGTNYYFTENSHAAKLTFDVQWNFAKTSDRVLIQNASFYGDAGASTLNAVLPDGKSDQLALRLQFQLIF